MEKIIVGGSITYLMLAFSLIIVMVKIIIDNNDNS